jgi:hypothetical protein
MVADRDDGSLRRAAPRLDVAMLYQRTNFTNRPRAVRDAISRRNEGSRPRAGMSCLRAGVSKYIEMRNPPARAWSSVTTSL